MVGRIPPKGTTIHLGVDGGEAGLAGLLGAGFAGEGGLFGVGFAGKTRCPGGDELFGLTGLLGAGLTGVFWLGFTGETRLDNCPGETGWPGGVGVPGRKIPPFVIAGVLLVKGGIPGLV